MIRTSYFLTFECHKQYSLLNYERSRRWFVDALANARDRYKFGLLAYVIMPQYANVIVCPTLKDCDIVRFRLSIEHEVASKALEYLNSHKSPWIKKLIIRKGDQNLFRFWQSSKSNYVNLTGSKELLNKIEYIHNDPIRKGFVKKPEEWKWSSARSTDQKKISNKEDSTYLVTFYCNEDLPLLNYEKSKLWFVEGAKFARDKFKFAILAYVILPQKAKLIVFPTIKDSDIDQFRKSVKRYVAARANEYLKEHNRRWMKRLTVRRGKRKAFRFWQAGPDENVKIRGEKELLENMQSIHYKPVKLGLVEKPGDWRWSSASFFAGKRHLDLDLDLDHFLFSLSGHLSICRYERD